MFLRMLHAEKVRHEDVVGGQERIVRQAIARDPQGGVVIAEDDVAGDDRRPVGVQGNAIRGIVVFPREAERPDRDLNGKLLADFAGQTRLQRLSGFQLSAGEFPETAKTVPVRRRAPRDEDFILVRQDRRSDGQLGFFRSLNAKSLPGAENRFERRIIAVPRAFPDRGNPLRDSHAIPSGALAFVQRAVRAVHQVVQGILGVGH